MPPCKTELQVTRQAWVDSRLQGEPHPSGMFQRVVMWCKLIIALRQAYAAIKPEEVQELFSGQKERVIRKTGGAQAGWDAAVAHWGRGLARTQSLSELAPSQIEQDIFRLKPTFREPFQGKPWIWKLVSDAAAIARRPNRFYSHRMARHSTKRQGQGQGQEQGKPWKSPPCRQRGFHGRIARRRYGYGTSQPSQTQGL